ncbi:MAG: hypothetical protein ABSH45_21445 [Bryobacteraceae bacterium]|jgi:hypothetical protein
MSTKQKVLIGTRALIARVNRKLKHEDQQLRTARSQGTEITVGKYFVVSTNPNDGNAIMETHVDLGELGQCLGVIQPWEALEK